MIAGKLGDFIAAFGADVSCATADRERYFAGGSIDSRTIKPQNIFFCVRGEKHDGHDFIAEAVSKGASIVVVDRTPGPLPEHIGDAVLITVPDALWSMGELAREYLSRLNLRKVAITGTNGKTTCKNMITQMLCSHSSTCSTFGNFNNLFGVPLSILEFDTDCTNAVFEFGMSTQGEIARLVEIVAPDIRVILNIGPAHLETMKTLDAIADAKFEILLNAKPDDWAVLNLDDPLITSRSDSHQMQKLGFGTSSASEIRPVDIYTNGSGHTHFTFELEDVRIPIIGRHHLTNCLATCAVGKLFGLTPRQIKQGVESFQPEGSRMASELVNGVTIINDTYNANPVSMRGALETLASMPATGKRVAVLGDMLELGAKAEEFHQELGRHLAGSGCQLAVLTGEFAGVVREAAIAAGMTPANVSTEAELSEIVAGLAEQLNPGDLLLVKASRALQLEKVVEGLRRVAGGKN